MVASDAVVADILHVADLFTTLARLAGALSAVPTDRVIDGVDQSALLLEGEAKGRRDHVFLYSGDQLKAVVKEQFKLFVPAEGENPVGALYFDLFRDTREELPVSTEVGAWGGAEFMRIIQRHLQHLQKYPREPPATGVPYDGVSNLRPESKAAVDGFLMKQRAPEL